MASTATTTTTTKKNHEWFHYFLLNDGIPWLVSKHAPLLTRLFTYRSRLEYVIRKRVSSTNWVHLQVVAVMVVQSHSSVEWHQHSTAVHTMAELKPKKRNKLISIEYIPDEITLCVCEFECMPKYRVQRYALDAQPFYWYEFEGITNI